MKNNKGFTLVELLAVIVILLAISSVVGWEITGTLERREVKECKEQVELAKGAAKIYFSINKSQTEVTIETLKKNEYFANNSKTDKLKDSDKIYIERSKGTIKYNKECE